jgi:hypothetical protein
MNRRRLDFEAMRDSLLDVCGQLDLKEGGPSVELTGDKPSARRAVYGFIDRQNLPGLFRTFDYASPDSTSPMRFQTTVPQQALFMMNSPFVMGLAQHLSELPEVASQGALKAKIRELYERVYGRAPTSWEESAGMGFVNSVQTAGDRKDAKGPTPWALYAQVLLSSNEFLYID